MSNRFLNKLNILHDNNFLDIARFFDSYNNTITNCNISAEDNNLDSIWWYNGTDNITYTSEEYYTFQQGSNTIIAYANDSLGNENSTSVTFYIDSIAPSITLTSPQDGASYGYNTSLALEFSVSDSGVGIDSCWYNINNGNNISLPGCQNTTFNVSRGHGYNLVLTPIM